MKVNLLTQSSGPYSRATGTLPVSLTISPTCGLPGDFSFPTDLTAVLRLLRRATDLPATILKQFEGDIYSFNKAKLFRVELSDNVLTSIGYFID